MRACRQLGDLKNYINEWENIKIDVYEYIKNVITQGYKLPFKTLSNPCILKNTTSAREIPEFVKGRL